MKTMMNMETIKLILFNAGYEVEQDMEAGYLYVSHPKHSVQPSEVRYMVPDMINLVEKINCGRVVIYNDSV